MQMLQCMALTWALLACASTAARADDQIARGEYLVHIMGCNDCHTAGTFLGKPDAEHPLAGGDVGLSVPGLGVRWAPNLTPDEPTGLGQWSDADIIKAIRAGVDPTGSKLFPMMPSGNYAVLTDADAGAIVAYLRTLPPVSHAVPAPVGPDENTTVTFFKMMNLK